MKMNDENITIMSLENAILQADDSEMDWDRIRREKAAEIERILILMKANSTRHKPG